LRACVRDLGRGNGDPGLALFGAAVTPNEHALARGFVTLDNFYDPGEVSGNGWPWSADARETDVGVREIPIQYAGRGQSYDVEGTNREINVAIPTLAGRRAADPITPADPDLLRGMSNVGAPLPPAGEKGGGHLWDAALRAHLSVGNYGFYCDLARYDPSAPDRVALERDPFGAKLQVAWAADPALLSRTDNYFRSFDVRYPDFWREKERLRLVPGRPHSRRRFQPHIMGGARVGALPGGAQRRRCERVYLVKPDSIVHRKRHRASGTSAPNYVGVRERVSNPEQN
jgi:hypothetical protein